MLEIKYDYIILRGVMGAGKTTTGKALFKQLNDHNIQRAYIPYDVMRKFVSNRKPTYDNKILHMKNTIFMANNFINEKYFTIIEGVFAIQNLMNILKKEVNGSYKSFRLTCKKEICYKRDQSKERLFSTGKENINFANSLFEKNLILNQEEIIIDNSQLSIQQVVDKIISEIII
jgi:adenylylsulfate kinase-like enzyme